MTSKFIMTFGATLAAALCGLALASPADAAPLLAQFELPAAEDVEFRSPDTQINSAERRRLFRDKMDRIRSHHRPIPVREDAVSFVQPRSARSVDMRSLRRAGRAGAPVIVTKSVITDPQVTTPPIDSRDVSPIAEPSMAVQGKNVLVTYNWGAAWSGDGGRKFIQLDPWRHFSNPAPPLRSEFCCDQAAIYSPDKNLMIWFLQGETSRDNPRQGNNIRLLIAGGKDIASRKWKVRDFTPETFGLTDIWFDFPDIATTEEHLFISLNMFSVDEKQENRGTIVLRMRLDRLTAADPIKVDRLVDSEMFGVRFAQGSRKTMFWASSETNHSWALGAWPDTAAEPMLGRSAEVEPWNFPREQFTTGSEGPNRLPWLKRVDSRLHTGWATADHVGFAWTSGAMRDSASIHLPLPAYSGCDLQPLRPGERRHEPGPARGRAAHFQPRERLRLPRGRRECGGRGGIGLLLRWREFLSRRGCGAHAQGRDDLAHRVRAGHSRNQYPPLRQTDRHRK